MSRLFAFLASSALLASAPARANTVEMCTPITVSVREADQCFVEAHCGPGETVAGAGSCSFRRCKDPVGQPIVENDQNVGWRCSARRKGDDSRTSTVSISCCRTVEVNPEPEPEKKKDAESAPGNGPIPVSQFAAAARVNKLGAQQAATIGAFQCLEGATELLAKKPDAESLIDGCQAGLAASKRFQALQKAAEKNGKLADGSSFEVDKNLLEGQRASITMAEFEKRFGPDARGLVSDLVRSGSTEALWERVGDKVKRVGFAEPPGEPAAPAAAVPVEPASTGSATSTAGMRNLKRLRFDDPGDSPPEREEVGMGARERITPLEGMFSRENSPEKDPELSLFDIVHRKYRDKTPALLPTWRVPRPRGAGSGP